MSDASFGDFLRWLAVQEDASYSVVSYWVYRYLSEHGEAQ